jgi:hypothetical protein
LVAQQSKAACHRRRAAITAEVKRGELRRFYVKQVESINEFADWSDEELKAFINSPMPLPHGKAKH